MRCWYALFLWSRVVNGKDLDGCGGFNRQRALESGFRVEQRDNVDGQCWGGEVTFLVACDINSAEQLIETRWRISLTLAAGRCGRQLRHTHTYTLCLPVFVRVYSIFTETKQTGTLKLVTSRPDLVLHIPPCNDLWCQDHYSWRRFRANCLS